MTTGPFGDERASAAGSDEGRRVLRNVASFGAFAIAPLQMALLSRALGPSGYGRWWWTFAILEAMMLIGMLGADLFIRREVPRLFAERRLDEIGAVVGSGLSIATVTGALFAGLLLFGAPVLARAQGDPELEWFFVILAAQPLVWNLTNGLTAALQSINVLGSVALVRGLVIPLLQVVALWLSWKRGASTHAALAALLAVSVAALVLVAVLYARHLPLSATSVHLVRPTRAGAALRYGLALLLPSVLWTLGGKLDLYVLGAHVAPALVGVYAASLQAASILPNTRTLFDPIAQAQIGGLHGRDDLELAASLRRLTRLCALAIAPAFVILVGAGESILSFLLGHPAPEAALPLTILCIGQLVGSLAVASWLVPMKLPGRLLTVIAALTLGIKLALLLLLVPRWTLVGAAIATATGTVLAQQGQALAGARWLRLRIHPRSLAGILGATCAIAAAGRLAFGALAARCGGSRAGLLVGSAALLLYLGVLPALLDRDERARLAARWRRG